MADSTPRDAGGFTRISEAPTNPHQGGRAGAFGLLDLDRSRFGSPDAWEVAGGQADEGRSGLDERLRQACFWAVVNTGFLS